MHRSRLIANNLSSFNWHPVVLTVSHKYYEESPDWDLVKTVNHEVEVHYTNALPVVKPRIIGDIGLRGIYFLYKRAKEIIKARKIDFIWIPIPSFYTSLLGRLLFEKFRIPYGIDYIDPWIRDISTRRNLRSVLSLWLARWLEPIAVKNASLITGVAYEYYRPVLERNFVKSSKPASSADRYSAFSIQHLTFPYGFDLNDYKIEPSNTELPWDPTTTRPIVYAGAFLPNARKVIQLLFQALKEMKKGSKIPDDISLYFIGTGNYSGETIQEMGEKYDLGDLIYESRERIPYLNVLHLLKNAHGVMVIGSTEPHYTASKIYQALLSRRPVMALLHIRSQAYEVLNEIGAEDYSITFNLPDESLIPEIKQKLTEFFSEKRIWKPDLKGLTKYSAHEAAGILVEKMEEIIGSCNEQDFIDRK